MVCLLKPCKVSNIAACHDDRQENATGLPGVASSSCLFGIFSHTPYSEEEGAWDDGGCVTHRTGSTVTCNCDHLTHFALLLSPGIEVWPYDCMAVWMYGCRTIVKCI